MLLLELTVHGQEVGDPAPDFTLTTVSGSQFKLSDNSGKVVFMFLFGYACPHCLANGNNTETGIYDFYEGNANFVAIGIDTWDGSKSGVENFISQTGITYPAALNGSSVQSLYSTTYDRIIVVDQNGIIKYKATSNATAAVVSDAKQVIDGLLTLTAVEDVKHENEFFKVFPVPAQENIYLENISNEFNYNVINIISSSGKVVISKKIAQQDSNGTISLPIKHLSEGIYIVQLVSSEKIQARRIIITNN